MVLTSINSSSFPFGITSEQNRWPEERVKVINIYGPAPRNDKLPIHLALTLVPASARCTADGRANASDGGDTDPPELFKQ